MKSFRDPVHNLIAFEDSDRFVIDLINTAEFQRLRRIRQLGMGNIAYPGAEHSRFVHSLGVAHMMRRVLDASAEWQDGRHNGALRAEVRAYRNLAIAAALLHDIGHGPFSHALEGVTSERHELWTTAIIRSPTTEVHQVLEGYESGFSEQVALIVEKRFEPSRAVVKLLSSQLDTDRIDYLLRDALMTGAGYGTFDVEWLIHVMRIGEVAGEPEVGLDLNKGQSIAEDYIMCRYYMYLHVYFHKTTRAAEVMVEKLLQRARMVGAYLPGFSGLNALLEGSLDAAASARTAEYLELDDAVLWTAIHLWSRNPDDVLRDFAQRLLNRRVFRGVDVKDGPHRLRLMEALEHQARLHGVPPAFYVVHDTAASHAYQDVYVSPSGWDDGDMAAATAEGTGRRGSEQIYLFDERGRPHELSEQSFIVKAVRDRKVKIERVLCPEDWLRDGTSE
ncbi:MAG: HD domain-containing protein [Bacilli bacterium]